VLIDRENLPRHRPWILFVATVTVLATIWFFVEVARVGGRPSGSSPPGLVFGILSGLIILFEFLLWPRKMVRSWRIGRAETWLRAHIWLGILSLPLAVYHSGFRMGGPLSSILIILFLVVIASGVAGLLLQQTLPSLMLRQVPGETIYSQISHVLSRLRDDADQLVEAICGSRIAREDARVGAASSPVSTFEPVVVGAMGQVGGVQGRLLQTVIPAAPVAGSEILYEFYQRTVRPFLLEHAGPDSPFHSAQRSSDLFQDLRTKLDPDAFQALDALESLCEQRRQLDRQARIHFWLHSWLWVHLPLSAAVVFLLVVHACVAIRYW
jgi:hypothetical protein